MGVKQDNGKSVCGRLGTSMREWLKKFWKGFQRTIVRTPALILIAIVWLICLSVITKYCLERQCVPLASQEITALTCILFLVAWWLVYFTSPVTGLPTLRNYLKHHSKIRGANAGDSVENKESLESKSRSTISTIALFSAAMSLFLAFMLRIDDSNLTLFQAGLREAIVLLAFSTILLFIFSIDLLDTITNHFNNDSASADGDAVTDIQKKLIFYQSHGNIWPKGGITHAYLGYAIFTIILTMSVAYFYPNNVGYFTAFFVYLGYPILFGYKMNNVGDVNTLALEERVFLRNSMAKWTANIGVFLIVILTLLTTS